MTEARTQERIKSEDSIMLLRVKHTLTIAFQAKQGLVVQDEKGRSFSPLRAEVQWWLKGDGVCTKAHVTLVGQRGHNGYPQDLKIGLTGCPTSYKPCPIWLMKLLREFGYQEPIEKVSP